MSGKTRISENDLLKRALRDAYSLRERQEPLPDDFRAKVMERIRRIGPLQPALGFWPAFENLVWRLAPVSCLLVIVLGAFLMSTDYDLAYDYLDTLRSEVENHALVELFALEG